MRTRHKIPSVFSLSMVDVLCCALGCVILLWLLNAKQNEDEALEHRQEHDSAMASLARSQEDQNQLTDRLRDLSKDRDEALVLTAKLSDLSKRAKDEEARLRLDLARLQKLAEELAAKLAATDVKVGGLEKDLAAKSKQLGDERKSSGTKVADLELSLKKLQDALAAALSLQRLERTRADGLKKEMDKTTADLGRANGMLAEAKEAIGNLDKALSGKEKQLANALAKGVEREKALQNTIDEGRAAFKKALDTIARLQKEGEALRTSIDNRFAGIELTGRSVLFVVDLSGSMMMVDENTEAPNKWPEVCKTVSRLMRSMPELKQYQVIVFADKAEALGAAGKWQPFDSKTSPAATEEALLRLKPKGGTNMWEAFKLAFEYRAHSLDAIYLLSDGLPNRGEGLPKGKENATGVEKGQLLGRHVLTTLRTNWNKREVKRERVKIHTIGFFFESPDLGAFLWALARENEGSFVGMAKP